MIFIFVAGIVLTILSYWFLDTPVALLVDHTLKTEFAGSAARFEFPDYLLPIVLCLTIFSWTFWIFAKGRGEGQKFSALLLHLGLSLPVSYLLTLGLKYVFGRTDLSVWLKHPDLTNDFHWFQGGGSFNSFPSGHMAVFGAIAFAFSKAYPKARWVTEGFLAILGLALVITGHHFISDVISGYCVALAISGQLRWAGLNQDQPKQDQPKQDQPRPTIGKCS